MNVVEREPIPVVDCITSTSPAATATPPRAQSHGEAHSGRLLPAGMDSSAGTRNRWERRPPPPPARKLIASMVNCWFVPPFSRREILRTGAPLLGVVLAGCLTSGGSAPTDTEPQPSPSETSGTFDIPTPAPGECTTTDLPRPTPTAEGLEPKGYPDYPDALTEGAVKWFVGAFELAYLYNEFLVQKGTMGYDEVRISGGATTGTAAERANGYVVRAGGVLKAGVDVTPTPPERLLHLSPTKSTPGTISPSVLRYGTGRRIASRRTFRGQRSSFVGNVMPGSN